MTLEKLDTALVVGEAMVLNPDGSGWTQYTLSTGKTEVTARKADPALVEYQAQLKADVLAEIDARENDVIPGASDGA